jgi:hypothetical protein
VNRPLGIGRSNAVAKATPDHGLAPCDLRGFSSRSLRLKAFPRVSASAAKGLLATRDSAYLLDRRTTLKVPASPLARPALSSATARTPSLFLS